MDSVNPEPTAVCHVVAMPFPGRGHINPMMNLCKLLASRTPRVLITFVVTEEWLGYIGDDPKPDTIRFSSIPNVIPSERLKAADFPGFYEAVMTKMQAPFEQLLDQLDQPVTAIIGDVETPWIIRVGNQRDIPVASLWTMSATVFSMFYHFDLFKKNRHLTPNLFEDGEHVPGVSLSQLADIRTIFHRDDPRVLQLALDCISTVPKAQFLLFTSVFEVKPKAIDTLKAILPLPVYTIGPAIPYLNLKETSTATTSDHMQWLDSQPKSSVLYISPGSFLSVSSTQMDEIVAGLRNSGVRFLWVARGEAWRLKEACDDIGLVVPWCDQLKVLGHSSVGGFWTHCGWNSTLEAVFSGVPMLTFPLFLDQDSNSRQIVEDWKMGWMVEREGGKENWVSRQYVAEIVKRFMDLESREGKQLRRKAREFRDICEKAIAKGGSSAANLYSFINYILQGHIG